MREVRQGQFYRHFKNRLYQIVAVAEHSETGEQMVVYQALYGDYRVYVRPYEMFVSEVDHEKYPDVSQKYRFELVEFTRKEDGQENRQETAREDPAEEEVQKEQPVLRTDEMNQVDPVLLEFLDADTLEEKMHILAYNRNRMTEGLLNSIAISLDLVVEKKGIQAQYDEIMNCLGTMERFECNRMRKKRKREVGENGRKIL